MPLERLISARQLTIPVLHEIFQTARKMRTICQEKGRTNLLADKMIGLVFLEPSSRTLLSFQSAAQRLGAGIVFIQGVGSTSFEKGESLSDAIKVVSGYCDLIVARLPKSGDAQIASDASCVPFINAGDGGNEHPTQSLVDTFTIIEELGTLSNLQYAFGFDPLQSRSIHSLCLVLSQFENIGFEFISPPELMAPRWLVEQCTERSVRMSQSTSLAELKNSDVIYLNRLQEERFPDRSLFEKYRYEYRLTPEEIPASCRLILDPLPRVDEIALSVDELPIAGYFRQAQNGVYLRMALLAMLLGRNIA
ncbi:MAG: aspartate carbamoyltransferase [Planctomycetota bacterium]|nr:MAG: aspartate carbamoyltransferase [Planctomycetota bacterium]